MNSLVLKALDLFGHERKFRLRLFLEGLAVGVATGAVVAAFRYLLELPEIYRPRLIELLTETPPLILPFAALLLLAGIILYHISAAEPLTSGSGIPQLKGVLAGDITMHWLRVLLLKFVGGVVAIGCGLSLGREGPSVQLGGCVGQGVGQAILRRRPRSEIRYLTTAGSGAGLAAAFNAPLAGVIFCLEELSHNFSPLVLMGTIAAAVSATAVAQLVFGGATVFRLPELAAIPVGPVYLLFMAMGAFCGLLGLAFTDTLLLSLDLFSRRVPPRLRPFVPLTLAAVLLFALPQVLGGGAGLVESLSAEPPLLGFLLLLLAAKFAFTMISFGSGVPGGIFLPMLVLGALGGAVFEKLAVAAGVIPAGLYANHFIVFGMAAYFSAVVKAPVTGCILIMEMTGTFSHLLILIAVAIAAYITVDICGGQPVYDALLERMRRIRRQMEQVQRAGQNKVHHPRNRLILELTVGTGSRLNGRALKDIPWPNAALVVNIRRDNLDLAPRADFVLAAGDYIHIMTDDEDIRPLEELAGEKIGGSD